MADLGLYEMSNSLNSIAHFVIRPEESGFDSIARIRRLVYTVILCPSKYSRNFLFAVTKASITFSVVEYLASASTKLLLVKATAC